MVSISFTEAPHVSRWIGCFALSLLANVVLVSLIRMDAPAGNVPYTALKVNLMALAAPAPVPVQEQAAPVRTPPPSLPEDVVAAPQASQAVTARPAPMRKPAPPQPQPVVREAPPAATPAPRRSATMPPSAAGGHDASTVIAEAQYRRQTLPVYPPRARELGQQGTVILHALVATSGLPQEIRVASSSGHRLLDRAAVSAVRDWEFVPTRRNGAPVQSWVRVPVKFVIQ